MLTTVIYAFPDDNNDLDSNNIDETDQATNQQDGHIYDDAAIIDAGKYTVLIYK
jgi:hypothetical protein